MVRVTLHEKALSEYAFSYGWETGKAGAPDPLKVDLEISQLGDLLKDKTKIIKDASAPSGFRTVTLPGTATFAPGSAQARNVMNRIKRLKAATSRVKSPFRRAGAVARQAYEGGLGMAQSAISGTALGAAKLTLGKGTQSVGIVPLGIATTEEPRPISQINRG